MTENEIQEAILQVCKVSGNDSDFNVLGFYTLCDRLVELGAAAEREACVVEAEWYTKPPRTSHARTYPRKGAGMKCERCGEVNPAEIHTCTPNNFNPDWNVMAVMVEEQQRMAKHIEELEAQLAQQEPVAIVTSDFDGGNKSIKFLNDVAYMNLIQKTLLYTAPPQR